MLQRISVDKKVYNLFFDSGCGDLVCKKRDIDALGPRANIETPGPITLRGVGDTRTISEHGIYKIILPLADRKTALLCGLVLDQVTCTFPTYKFEGKVKDDINKFHKKCGISRVLPGLPDGVGGETDILIGIKCLKYFPREVMHLPSGLTVYKSVFSNPDGGRGVIGGPHPVFTAIERHFNDDNATKNFLNQQIIIVYEGYQICPDTHLLNLKSAKDLNKDRLNYSGSYNTLKCKKMFDIIEVGTNVNYRCVSCRNCAECKNGGNIELISIQDEFEQDVINKSVEVYTDRGITYASLPFIESPKMLAPNKSQAMSVYRSQVKKLNKNTKDKNDVIKSEYELQDLGFVEFVSNLSKK